jgi:citrate lyase subunit beta/citryl-CoA lyase
MKPLNSLLFVPASRPERIAKALAASADAVIVDLEDAVAPADKDAARAALAAALDPARPVMVRINSADTPWFPADLELLRHPGVLAAVLPKAEDAEDVAVVAEAAAGRPVLPLVESALGFERRMALAHAPGVERLVFGQIDFQADMGMRCNEEELLPLRAALVLASRLAHIAPPIDGPTTAIDDEDALRTDARRARRLGFGGKLCIHPRQVAVVNQCFTPDADEIAWAQRVIAADSAAGGAAVAVDGKMVDRPVVLRAQSILADASARTPR